MQKICGIYIIISPTAKIYVGQSVNIKGRWESYKHFRTKKQVKVLASIKKHGYENHFFDIIEVCSVDELNERERFWQDEYDVLGKYGLNCKLTETSDKSGYLSKETRDKIGETSKGRKFSQESIKKRSESLSSTWKNKTKEEREEFYLAHSKENNSFFGKTHSVETKNKMRQAKLGKKGFWVGKTFSDEHKAKLKAAWAKRSH